MPRGGARPGSGRDPKKDKRINFTIVIHPETAKWIRAEAKRREMPQGRLIENLLGLEQDKAEDGQAN